MSTPRERVEGAIRFFFEQALSASTGRSLAQLENPQIHLGAYARHAGGPVQTPVGQSVTPAYALRVSAPLPVADGRPNPAGVEAGEGSPVQHLLWLRHAADPTVDTEEEIQRVMADLDTFADLFADVPAAAPGTTTAPTTGTGDSGTGTTGGAPGAGPGSAVGGGGAASRAVARAADWARGVVASRAALGVSLDQLTEIPTALREVTDDLDELKQVLRHFFTYTPDGAPYRRWSGAGRDAGNGAHLTPEYKQHNVREVKLERHRVYLYAVVPEGLLTGAGGLGEGAFREFVLRFDETGVAERPFQMATLHSARWRRGAAAYHDFVFFYAEEGDGLPMPPEVREKLSADLVALLGQISTAGDTLAGVLRESPQVLATGADSRLVLLATVHGEPQVPAGVIMLPEGGTVRTLVVPADLAQVQAVAALPQVRHLGVVPPPRAANDQARTLVNQAGLTAKLPAGKQGGAGVVVGVIDTGVDGSHPAFAGRLHSYWDQATAAGSVLLAGNTPAQNNPGNAAYTAFNFGVELTGAATSGAQDSNGHGTHVAGTAAGAEVRDGAGNVLLAAGLAPQATIVGVRAIDAGPSNFLLGIRYIFQKATELGRPCVINMSFGQHRHPHDGTDAVSRGLVDLVTDAAGNYRPGRILVAAVANDRGKNYHVRRTLPPRGTRSITAAALYLPLHLGVGLRDEHINIWVRNPNGVAPGTAFPLNVWVYRRSTSNSRNTPSSVTRLVPLGQDTSGTANGAGTFPTHRVRIDVVSGLADPFNGDFSIQVFFRSTDPVLAMLADQWVIALDNQSTHTLDVHAWVASAPSRTRFIPQGFFVDDETCLVAVPAASPAAVGVASCNSRLNWTTSTGTALTFTHETALNEISTFSSPGPLRPSSIPIGTVYPNLHHEFQGVDVTAPGCRLQSALSSQCTPDPSDVCNARSQMMQGTSMAAPVITGLVANLLGDETTLTLPQVLDRLRNASRIPAASEYQPPAPPTGTPPPARPYSVDWGYGLVDAAQLRP